MEVFILRVQGDAFRDLTDLPYPLAESIRTMDREFYRTAPPIAEGS